MNDFSIVVRSADERTTTSCIESLKKLFPHHVIHVTKECPFSAAIKRTFSIALEEGRDWTLCIDADVLVTDAIYALIQKRLDVEQSVFQIQGLVLDKFIHCLRPAGNHLYRNAYMKQAMEHIPKEGTSLRPETHMLTQMARLGYPWKQVNVVVGLHDYEQHYHDIFRKCFLHAHKHDWLDKVLEAFWEHRSPKDGDYTVALLGYRFGKNYNGTVLVDRNHMEATINEILKKENMVSKDAMKSDSCVDSAKKEIEAFTMELAHVKSVQDFQNTVFPISLWERMVHDAP